MTLLERDAAPADKVCGDFLSVEAQAILSGLGLDPAGLGAAPIHTVRLAHGGRVAEAALPFPALGLSRRRLDAALLDLASARGAEVRRGVRALALQPDGVVTTTAGPLRSDAIFLATGKHELRGAARAAAAADWVGFKTYLALAPAQRAALRGAVELALFDGGYAGMLLVEGEAANLSLIVSAAKLASAGGTWEGLLAWLRGRCPLLGRRLNGATALLARPLAVSRVPYGFLHAPRGDDPVWRMGDQMAVIPSLTGDGVALALHTAARAAAAWQGGRSAGEHHAALRRELAGQMRLAGWVHLACLAAPVQGALVGVCRHAPIVMRLAASLTRVGGPPSPNPLLSGPEGEGVCFPSPCGTEPG